MSQVKLVNAPSLPNIPWQDKPADQVTESPVWRYSGNPVSVFSGVTAEAGAGVRVIGVPEGGHGSDLAIVCLGITAEDEGEEGCSANNMGGDRASYSLPAAQLRLLESYRKSCNSTFKGSDSFFKNILS